jgi:hypothetical protein
MRTITDQEFRKVDGLIKGFSDALLGTQPNAVESFMRKLSWGEKMRIGSAKLAYEFAKNADPNTKAEKLVQYCEAVVPALTRTFGEAAVIKALPVDARTQEVCDICEQLGGRQTAALIRKSL